MSKTNNKKNIYHLLKDKKEYKILINENNFNNSNKININNNINSYPHNKCLDTSNSDINVQLSNSTKSKDNSFNRYYTRSGNKLIMGNRENIDKSTYNKKYNDQNILQLNKLNDKQIKNKNNSINIDKNLKNIFKIYKDYSNSTTTNSITYNNNYKITPNLLSIKEIKSNIHTKSTDVYSFIRSSSLGGRILFKESNSKIIKNICRYNSSYFKNKSKSFSKCKKQYNTSLINNISLCYDNKDLEYNNKTSLYLLTDNDSNKLELTNNFLILNNNNKINTEKSIKFKQKRNLDRNNYKNSSKVVTSSSKYISTNLENEYALFGLYKEMNIGLSLKWQIPLNTRVIYIIIKI